MSNYTDNEYISEYEDDYQDNYADDNSVAPDNTKINYSNKNICIRTNNDNRKNDGARKSLKRLYPDAFQDISDDEFIQKIISKEFPEGLRKKVYAKNLTLDENSDYRVLAIRPEVSPRDYLSTQLPEGETLLFKGHVSGKVFLVDYIGPTFSGAKMDYEIECDIIRYDDASRVGSNFLYQLCDESDSLMEYTKEKLHEWKDYLDWKEAVTREQLHGCKYFKADIDDSGRLIFSLVCSSKEWFKSFRRYLYKDIQAFSNDYSKDKWIFRLADNERGKRFNNFSLGRCSEIIKEYYPFGEPELNVGNNIVDEDVIQKEMNDYYNAYEYDEDDYSNGSETDEVDVMRSIGKAFEHPYIVDVAFDISNDDKERLEKLSEGEDEIEYIREYILSQYPKVGFLSLSDVGTFVLIRRFKQAVNRLERDEDNYSLGLPLWLFNIANARVPDRGIQEITEWLNPEIQNNENQKEAIYKMLAVPDICLIQGPPGTGKTTVIAEAIYQFVKQGNRVLLASQSNDAVDNALERLVSTPSIRAIRFGIKNRRKKDEDNISKFAEDTALQYYYYSLSHQIDKTWLEKWENLQNSIVESKTDIRDVQFYQQDITILNNQLADNLHQRGNILAQYNDCKSKRTEAMLKERAHQNAEQQYYIFKEYMQNGGDEEFFMPTEYLYTVANLLNPVIAAAQQNGVYITQGVIDLNILLEHQANTYIKYCRGSINLLTGIVRKLGDSKTGSSCENDIEIGQMEREQNELLEKMENTEDEDLQIQLLKKYKNIKKQISQLSLMSKTINFSKNEQAIIDKNLQTRIEKGDCNVVADILNNLISSYKKATEESLTAIMAQLKSYQYQDIDGITNREKAFKGQYESLETDIVELRATIAEKQNTCRRLAEKYDCQVDAEIDEIVIAIKSYVERIQKEISQNRQVKEIWEPVMKELCDRLRNNDNLEYDKAHNYQEIYVNACNVVGISCTADMRELNNNGYNCFDVVIIDEVSKATPPELLIPLMKARKAILVGDHRQLPPTFNEHENSYNEVVEYQQEHPEEANPLITEDNFKRFRKMVTASLFKEYFESANISIKHSLVVQYRMHSDIMHVINRFYEGLLENGLKPSEEQKSKAHDLYIPGADGGSFISPDKHAYWIDSSYLGDIPMYESRKKKSTSMQNIFEVNIIIEVVTKIANAYTTKGYTRENRKTIGIISFYQSQVTEIRNRIRKLRNRPEFASVDIDVNTVDRFQGKEKNIIITSLVRNNAKGKASRHVAAFERINVAFSRAQNLLIIVGAKNMYHDITVSLPLMNEKGYRTSSVYNNIMSDLHTKGAFLLSDKVISKENIESVLNDCLRAGADDDFR